MAGAMRKMGIYLGLVEDDRAGSEYETYGATARARDYSQVDYDDDPVRRREPVSEYDDEPDEQPQRPGAYAEPAATSSSTHWASNAEADESSYRITTLHPRTYNEARTIGEQFRAGIPVIINLSEMADADAKRLVDFAAGLTFGLRGSIERITNKVFLLSPQKVTVTAEDKARIVEGGLFNHG